MSHPSQGVWEMKASGDDIARAKALGLVQLGTLLRVLDHIDGMIQGGLRRDEDSIHQLQDFAKQIRREIDAEEESRRDNDTAIAALRLELTSQIDNLRRALAAEVEGDSFDISAAIKSKPVVQLIMQIQNYQFKENFAGLTNLEDWTRCLPYNEIKDKVSSTSGRIAAGADFWSKNTPDQFVEQTFQVPVHVAVPVHLATRSFGVLEDWNNLPADARMYQVVGGDYDFKTGAESEIRKLYAILEDEGLSDQGSISEQTLAPVGSQETFDRVLSLLEIALIVSGFMVDGAIEAVLASALEVGAVYREDALQGQIQHINQRTGPRFGRARDTGLNFNGPVMQITKVSGRVTGNHDDHPDGEYFGEFVRATTVLPGRDVYHPSQMHAFTTTDNLFGSLIGNHTMGLSHIVDRHAYNEPGFMGRVTTSPSSDFFDVIPGRYRKFRCINFTQHVPVAFEGTPFSKLQGLDSGRLTYSLNGSLSHPQEYKDDGTPVTYDVVFLNFKPYAYFDGADWHVRTSILNGLF